MSRNPRYDILFEHIKIGPVTAANRFYQTPYASGTGNQMPHARAAIREVRAEGGWGVVNTGYCSIHPSSDDAPLPYCRLWDDEDVKVQSLMVDAVHRHGALAGVELWHGPAANRLTRVTPMSATGVSYNNSYPGWMSLAKSRPMDRQDIRELRRWYVDAAKRARSAGFDIAVRRPRGHIDIGGRARPLGCEIVELDGRNHVGPVCRAGSTGTLERFRQAIDVQTRSWRRSLYIAG